MKKFSKRVISLLLVLLILIGISGCKKEVDIDIAQIRNIANLATIKCYFHNVAKSVKTKCSGVSCWLEKDRKFWIEYDGDVKYGIDISEAEMSVNDNVIIIKMPEAKVLNIGFDSESYDRSSIVVSNDSINPNKITSEDITAAINAAQEEMKASAESNTVMLDAAKSRAKTLIEEFIVNLGDSIGTEYTIEWE